MASSSPQAVRGSLRARSHSLPCLVAAALAVLSWGTRAGALEAPRSAGAEAGTRLLLAAAARDGASVEQVLDFAALLLTEADARQDEAAPPTARLALAGLREALVQPVPVPAVTLASGPARHAVGPLSVTRAEARALVGERLGRDRREVAAHLRGLLPSDEARLTDEALVALVPPLVALAEGPWSPDPAALARIRSAFGLPASGVAQ